MRNVFKFVNEVKLELSRVIWPKPDEFVGSTIVVIVLVSIMAIYFWQVDFWLNKLLQYLIRYFGA